MGPARRSRCDGLPRRRAEPGLAFTLRSPGTVTGYVYTDTVTLDHLYAWQVTALDAAGHESAASSVVQLAARRSDTLYIPQISPVTGGYVDVYAGGLFSPPYPMGTQLRLTPVPRPRLPLRQLERRG